MSGLVNKVKEAFHSAQDTPTDSNERTGKLNLTTEERERLEAAGYGAEHHAEKRHLGATEDITQAEGGHPPSYYLNQETKTNPDVPGAFPDSQADNIDRQHKDGREYVAPKGTHVGSGTATTSTTKDQVVDRNLTNPDNYSKASNITDNNATTSGTHDRTTDATIAGVAAGAGAGAGAAAIDHHESKTGPNKLHKREDPRGHVAFNEPPTHQSIHGTDPVPVIAATQEKSSTEPTTTSTTSNTETSTAIHHSIPRTTHQQTTTATPSSTIPSTTVIGTQSNAPDLYDQQASRKYNENIDNTNTTTTQSSNTTPNYSYPSGATTTTAAGGAAAGTAATTRFETHPGLKSGTYATPREAGNSTINTTTLPSTLTERGLDADKANISTGAGTGTAAIYGTSTYSAQPVGDTSPTAAPTGDVSKGVSGATATGGEHHYGPGHTGSKVLHTCTKCGEDNDITHYFRKESVYRLSQ